MTAWLIVLVVMCELIGIVVCRTVAGGVAHWIADGKNRSPDLFEWTIGVICGLLVVTALPLLVFVMVVKRVPAPRLAIERRGRGQRIRDLERRNQQLERELGIG